MPIGFVKVLKTNAYFKRYQVKYRRRREGKTDYQQRRLLITQDKNKYLTPKFRLVARISNKDVTCQVVSAELQGDRTHASAYAHDLKNYGIPVGHTNYAACYATGLLCARRLLTLKGLADTYAGVKEVTGEYYEPEEEGERRPFKCLLDIGLARPTVGNRVFACLKGAVDGGLLIPHGEGRFAGYKGSSLDAAALRSRVLGNHVTEWMEEMEEEDPDKFKGHFKNFLSAGFTADKLEGKYLAAHAAIRKDPKARDPAAGSKARKEKQQAGKKAQKDYRKRDNMSYSLAERQNRSRQKINVMRSLQGLPKRGKRGATAAADDDESE